MNIQTSKLQKCQWLLKQWIVSSFVENDWQQRPHPYNLNMSGSFFNLSLFSVDDSPFPVPDSLFTFISTSGQADDFSPVWIRRRWLLSPLLCLNFLSQSRHANGFSPVWILRCAVMLPRSLNFLSQSGHANGFSAKWIRRCRSSSLVCLNVLSHSGQAGSFSPVWILRCNFKSWFRLNVLSHSWHAKRHFTRVNSIMHN